MKSAKYDSYVHVTPESSKMTKHYDTLTKWGKELDQKNLLRVKSTLELLPTDISNVLDLGCGDGAIANPLSDNGLNITGVDISLSALKHLKGNGVLASADCLPFRDRLFDLVLCAETLEHLPSGVYERTLKEIERIASAYIIVTTPNEEYLPTKYTKCSFCHCTFHTNLHFRMYNSSSHRALFSKFSLIKTVEIHQWAHDPFLTQINQRLLGIYDYKEGIFCPYCGHMIQKLNPGTLKIAFSKKIKSLCKLFPEKRKARWLASLYRRKD